MSLCAYQLNPKITFGPGDQNLSNKKGLTSYGKPNFKLTYSIKTHKPLDTSLRHVWLDDKRASHAKGQVCHDDKSTTRFSCKEGLCYSSISSALTKIVSQSLGELPTSTI